MFSAMLFAVSVVALGQFAVYYWRAVLAGVAAQPVSDQILAAANVEDGHLTSRHFDTLAGLHELTPDLIPNRPGLGLVRFYHCLVEGLNSIAGAKIPSIAAWSEREGILCARYVAVQMDRRLRANLELAASLRSS